MTAAGRSFRSGGAADLRHTFEISARASYDDATRQGVLPAGRPPTEAEIDGDWRRRRGMLEFLAARPGGRYEICDTDDGPVAYARVVRFAEVEELTELMVEPDHRGDGIARALLERCWPGEPTAQLGRMVAGGGSLEELSLYGAFGLMPAGGRWGMQAETERYLELRAGELEDESGMPAHVLEPDHAVAEWNRLEPGAIGHGRALLHEFFARDRHCLACVDHDTGDAGGLCWVSSGGEIGPAVGATPRDLMPVVVAALDRVARVQEPERLSVFSTTLAWPLLSRLVGLGFRLWWPSWIMSSLPLPGLDRYAPTLPPQLL